MSINLRKRSRISYYEPPEPSIDDYIFCDYCSDYVYEYCTSHGPLLDLPDDKVTAKKLTSSPDNLHRAELSLPHVFMYIAPSSIPGAGLGVFAKLTLPKDIRLGPYKGTLEDKNNISYYSWQLYKNGKANNTIDGKDVDNSNWMRYVNCARIWFEQNLVAYQYRGQIYYRIKHTLGMTNLHISRRKHLKQNQWSREKSPEEKKELARKTLRADL